MPSLAFLLSAFLPTLAAVARVALQGRLGPTAMLIWLAGLVPVFLLTRYLGWRGSLIGLVWTSALVVLAELFAALLANQAPAWSFMGIVIAVTASVALGAGLERQWWMSRREAPDLGPTAEKPCADELPTGEILEFFLTKLFESARRRPPLSVVLFEVDRFDEYRELYGEARACQAVDVAVTALKSEMRASNMCGRIDNRTLVVFLSGERLRAAHAFASRVVEELATRPAPWPGRITISGGIAGFDPSMASLEDLKGQARRALDAARGMGGGVVVVAEGAGDEVLVTPGMVVLRPSGQVREIRGTV